MKTSRAFGAVCGFIGAMLSTSIHAVILTEDTTVALTGTTSAARPELAGLVIVDELHSFAGQDALGNILFTGTMQISIQRSFQDGTLDFTYRIRPNDASSLDAIFRTTHTDFSGWATDVDYRTDGLGTVGPSSATRNVSGSTVGFDFAGGLQPGEESLFYFIKTNATTYKPGSTVLINGGIAAIPSYAPAIPVPAAVWLFGSGLIGLIGVARRKKS